MRKRRRKVQLKRGAFKRGMVKIWCNNSECIYNQKLEKPKSFGFNRINYVPFDDAMITGKCTRMGYDFMSIDLEKKNVKLILPVCQISDKDTIVCDVTECLHNLERTCDRKEIWISKSPLTQEYPYYHCRCFSNKGVSHFDLGRLLNPDGTPKGGKVDDDYSEKLHKDNTVNKSYPDHIRQKI